MSYGPNQMYPGATELDPNYPKDKFKDNNPSTTNNGTPLKAIKENQDLTLETAVMNDAGFEYNGLPDTPQDSQLFAAYKASLSNGANLLSNHNFLIQTPDDSQPLPSATPTSYPPGHQIFSGVFANETTGITNLTYIDGRVSFSGGDLYFAVPNTGGIERLTDFAASVADFDGKPRTRGVSFSLVGDDYRVTVGIDALEDAGGNTTPLGSVKFEQGSVATGHEVDKIVGIESLLGKNSYLYPKNGSATVGLTIPANTTHLNVQGSVYPLYASDGSGSVKHSGLISEINLVSPVPYITADGVKIWLLDIQWFKGVPSYRSFWAKGNAQGVVGDVSDWESMQSCTDSVPTGGVLHKESGRYAVHRKVYMGPKSRVTVKGDGKFSTEIIPTSIFDELLYDCLVEYGDGTNNSNNITLQDFAAQSVYNSFGNDLSGCAVNVGYNLDIINCQFKSGNPVTKATGGLRIRGGKHTKIYHSNFHNGFGYGMIIDSHNVDLLIGEGNAFDETPSAIVSAGNILEMVVNSTSFGNCVPNPTNPTAADGVTIDLRVGAHGVVKITNDNTMKGSAFNKFGVRYNNVNVCDISGNLMSNFARYAIASEGNSSEDFSDNIFIGNGTESASSDPSTGTNDPETSPYTCDIFKLRGEVGGSKVCGNITDIMSKPFAWVRGDASSPYTTSLQVNSNNSDAYIHGKTYSKLRDFKNGYQDLQALPPYENSIAGFTIASGSEQSSNLTGISGAEPGDTVVINAKDGGLSPFLTLRGTCTVANIVRYYITNPSASSVVQADFDVTVQVTKN